MDRFPRVIAWLGGAFFLGFGLWAIVAPEAFFDAVATFEPYNQHFIQDVGAFQIGLGAVLLLAVGDASGDGLSTALIGTGMGAVAHVVSHAVGSDLGGTPEVDIPFLSIAGALLLVAGVVKRRSSDGA